MWRGNAAGVSQDAGNGLEVHKLQALFGVVKMRWKFNCFVCGETWEEEHRKLHKDDLYLEKKKIVLC